jgi:peptidoglycan/xylan/chitin deacetylase (PgdA/CDA1 family)
MDYAALRSRLHASYRKNAPEIAALGRGLYPRFVFARRPAELSGEIPVFHYHDVDAAGLERDLAFLATNGYATLTSAEFTRCLTGAAPIPDRAVLLTFDDGWRSLHTVAAPLLRRHGLRATAYLITGVMAAARDAIPAGSAAAVLVTWDEVRADRVVIDFQSHSHWHARVFVGPRLVDFLHPRFDRHALNLHVPVLRTAGADDFARAAPLGTPLSPTRPGSRAVRASSTTRARAPARSNWLPRARGAGYTSCCLGVKPGRRTNRPGDDPLTTVRLPTDYIHRLSGGAACRSPQCSPIWPGGARPPSSAGCARPPARFLMRNPPREPRAARLRDQWRRL